jgi:CubicO group peptidase (beta-lactamase class C family)/bifunctional DNase/RNase
MEVADVRLLGGTDRSPMERCQVVLEEVQGPWRIELWFTPSVAEWTASALRGVEVPWGSSPYHLGLQHLRKNGERITGVLLETLEDGTLRALLTIAGERGTRQLAGRPADSVTLAVLAGAPIRVAADVLEAWKPRTSDEVADWESEAELELKGSDDLAIELFERQDSWDPALPLPPTGPPVPVEEVGRRPGPSRRSEALPRALADRLDEEVARVVSEHRLVGLAIGLVWKGELAFFRTLGVRDATSLAPVTERTVFPMMSVTKTVTAVAVLQLWERGLFELDDPVDRYLKSVEILRQDEETVPVTIRRLITHTHGIKNEARKYIVPARQPRPTAREFFSRGVVAAGRAEDPWRYGQEGFALLGLLVEDLSGESFRDYVVGHIFDPLGMSDSDFQGGPRLGADRALGYERDLPGVYAFLASPWEMIVLSMGAGYSTIGDLSRYVAALSGRMPPEVLKPETFAAMLQPQVVVPVRWPAHFGLGVNLRYVEGAVAVGHNGGTRGFMTVVWAVPELELGIVMCTNTSGVPGLEREPPEMLLPIAVRQLRGA